MIISNVIGIFMTMKCAAMLVISNVIQYRLFSNAEIIDFRRKIQKDGRLKIINSSISNIKVVKFNAWEIILHDIAKTMKSSETKNILKITWMKELGSLLPHFTTILLTLAVYYLFIGFQTGFGCGKIFSMIMMLNYLEGYLSLIVKSFMQYAVSQDSIERFCIFLRTRGEYNEDQSKRFIEFAKPLKSQGVDGGEGWIAVEDCNFCHWGIKNRAKFTVSKVPQTPIMKESVLTKSCPTSSSFQLKDIRFEIDQGSFTAILGGKNSGKTSLLEALLGRMEILSGRVLKHGSVAYISKKPFLINDTILENILFGRPYNHQLYQYLLDVCELRPYLNVLSIDDKMGVIGKQGTILPNDLKLKVCIARALYSDSDIFLVDDCLDDFDEFTRKSIFEKIFLSLLTQKTVVMAINSLDYLHKFDQILVLKEGQLLFDGNIKKINKTQEFTDFIKQNYKFHSRDKLKRQLGSNSLLLSFEKDNGRIEQKFAQSNEDNNFRDSGSLRAKPESITYQELTRRWINDQENSLLPQETWKLSDQRTGLNTLAFLAKKSGGFVLILTLVAILFQAFVYMMLNLIIGQFYQGSAFSSSSDPQSQSQNLNSFWAKISLGIQSFGENQSDLTIWALFLILTILVVIRIFLYALFCSQASKKIFEEAVWKMLRMPIDDFENTSLSTIYERFGQDVETLDYDLSDGIPGFIDLILLMITTSIVLIVVCPFILILIPFTVGLLLHYITVFVSCSSKLHRLKRIIQSFKGSAVDSLFKGLIFFEIFKNKTRFYNKWASFHNRFQQVRLHSEYSKIWISNFVQLTFVSLAAVSIFIITVEKGFLRKNQNSKNLVLTGLGLVFVIILATRQSLFGDHLEHFSKCLSAAQSLKEFSETEFLEPDLNVPVAIHDWPMKGVIEVVQLVAKRAAVSLKLEGLSFTAKQAQKVGIVGEIDSGKSLLPMYLMRMMEPVEGMIKIDGINIAEIGIHWLRRAITMIPNNPYLFEGSLKYNLDPYNQYSTKQIIEILKASMFFKTFKNRKHFAIQRSLFQHDRVSSRDTSPNKSYVNSRTHQASKKGGVNPFPTSCTSENLILEFYIESGGKNLTLGQKHMLCIIRSILQKSRIVIIEEPTTKIDAQAFNLIQKLIKTKLQDTTVITITHRLNTVIQYDNLVVLKDGKKIEEGAPLDLIAKDGYFRKLFSSKQSFRMSGWFE